MRADARRNRQHILEVARDVFFEHGADAPLDDIARRAGVGAGTLYRHFPNRDALVEAVYRDDIERLADRAYELLEDNAPDEALEQWLRENLVHALTRKGLAMTLKATLGPDNEVFQLCKSVLYDAADALLLPSRQTGRIRSDVTSTELLRLTHGIAFASESEPALAPRLLAIMLDGLRLPAER
jgi:AcrR family transcriptional regulator